MRAVIRVHEQYNKSMVCTLAILALKPRARGAEDFAPQLSSKVCAEVLQKTEVCAGKLLKTEDSPGLLLTLRTALEYC